MFLREIEGREPPAGCGRFGDAIRHARRAGVAVPGIYHLFAANPATARPLCDLMQALMRGPSDLSPGQRELIAAWTSAQNRCLF
jgi:alkylhydroperoxidase family enzyme